MFYLLFFCSYLVVCSEIQFSESLCFIRTSRFISVVHNLTCFCLIWGFTELILRTHMRALFVLCVYFYKHAFPTIYLKVTILPIIDILSYQVDFHMFCFRCWLA